MTFRISSRVPLLLCASAISCVGSAAPVDWLDPGYVVTELDVRSGLPGNVLTSIARDPHGYLWVTSHLGLARYDGFEVVVFDGHDPPRHEGNQVIHQAWDAQGTLWLVGGNGRATGYRDGRVQAFGDDVIPVPGRWSSHRLMQGGEIWFATDTQVLRRVRDRFETVCSIEAGVMVRDMAPLPDGSALLATESHGALRCDGAVATPMPELDALTGPIHSVHAWKGAVWLLDAQGLHRFDHGGLATVHALRESHSTMFRASRLEARGGRLWARTSGPVLEVTGDAARVVVETPFAGGWVRNFVAIDARGASWIAHGSSLYRDGREVLRLGVRIVGLELGSDGSVWIASAGRGVHQLRPRLGEVFERQPLLRGANLYAVIESRQRPGRFLFGGLASGLLELEDDVVRKRPDATAEFDADTIWSLLEDRRGRIWQGGLFLCIRDPEDRCDTTGVPRELGQGAMPGHDVRLLLEAEDGAIWIGSSFGLYRYANAAFERIGDAGAARVRAGLQRADGSLWFGTADAGVRVWRDGRLWSLQAPLASQRIRSIYEDTDGVLWIGTEDRGLIRLRVDASLAVLEQRVFGSADGLWDDTIHRIEEDAQGRLWMSTNRGIFWIERDRLATDLRAERATLPVVGYDERDGLLNREANGGTQSAGLSDSENRIWFVGQTGAVRIDPATVPRPEAQPPPRILAAGAPDSILQSNPAATTLEPRQRNLTVRYTAPIFRNSERAQFRYRLAGYDETWTDAGTRREAFYTNLPPGEFMFEVQATNGHGVISSITTLPVKVLPRYYERTWFAALFVLLLLALATALYRWRIAQLQQRSRQLEQQIAERTRELKQEKQATEKALDELAMQAEKLRETDAAKSRFFANISHELRTPLTLILGPAQQAEELLHQSSIAEALQRLRGIRQNGQQLLTLVNQILELSRLDAGYRSLKPAVSDLAFACQQILERFLPLASQRRVTLSGPVASASCVCEFDVDALSTILGNLVTNAIRHSAEGSTVRLRLREVAGGVVLSVRDEGPGIPPERLQRVFDRFYTAQHEGAGSGIGLALARELAHLHGGDLTVRSTPGAGCTFELVLPLVVIAWIGDEAREAAPYAQDPVPTMVAGDEDAAAETRKLVLVVEDVDEMRDYVASCLAPEFTVVCARDGAEGLAMARRKLPDLIVSDVMMPQLDGATMAKVLARSASTSAIPVILLTARSTESDELLGFAAGAVDYLTKPFAPEILLARVKRLLGFAHRLREQLRSELADRARLSAMRQDTPSLADRLQAIVLARLDDIALDVEHLAQSVHMSRSQLKRRMKEEGLSAPSDFIRDARLRIAAELLQRKRGSVTEVAYAVGFASLSHFSHRFRERFGVSPSAYADSTIGVRSTY